MKKAVLKAILRRARLKDAVEKTAKESKGKEHAAHYYKKKRAERLSEKAASRGKTKRAAMLKEYSEMHGEKQRRAFERKLRGR